MPPDDPGDRASEAPQDEGGASFAARSLPWLLRQKVTIPDRVAGYVHRAELVDRAMPTRRRLTVLKATAGFGKTTLLAECCRRLRQDGVATAYISLDEHDTPDTLDTYIAFACASAGLNTLGIIDVGKAVGGPANRVAVVVREIQSLDRPVVIAFDELERLSHPASVAILDFLLQRGPSNLHLAFACRRIPDGLNVAGAMLEGRMEVLGTEDLRFSRGEVARFFDLGLSRRTLGEEVSHSAGWPFALRISRNSAERSTAGGDGNAEDIVSNWMESRLFAQLGKDDRDLVLDLGLFGWFDEGLLGETLRSSNTMRRVQSMAVLEGLLERVGSDATGSWRLHALAREHCARQRFREDRERFCTVHRRIATALEYRGEILLAMRHAVTGGDPFLAGEIFERAGGVRFWTRRGVAQYQEANRLLTEEVVAKSPRLKLARCASLTLAGRHHEARALYGECFQPGSRKATSGTEYEGYVDDCIVRGGMGLYGGEPLGSDWMQTLSDEIAGLVRSPRLDPATRGHFEYSLCVLHFQQGRFEHALENLSAARELMGTPYLACHGELLHGQIDFVRGRVRDAESHFRRCRRIARKWFPGDPVVMTGCEIALREVTLETGRIATAAEPPGAFKALQNEGVPFGYFAIIVNVLIDTRVRSGRVDQALDAADMLLAHVRRTGLTRFARLLAALRTSLLVIAGRVGDAERAWKLQALPDDPAACVDLASQTWREMEAVSEARVRLLTARGRFAEARTLLLQLRSVAAERSLRRLLMRALALAVVLEQHAGEAAACARHLTEYFGLFSDSPYAWPLVRERTTCAKAVSTFLESNADSPHAGSAASLLAAMDRAQAGPDPSFSEREREVLRRLPDRSIKEVATSLGLSVHGVRYHLRKLFAKMHVSNRTELLRRAREVGLIPEDS